MSAFQPPGNSTRRLESGEVVKGAVLINKRCCAGGAALQVGLGGPRGRHQPSVCRHGRAEERLHAHGAAHDRRPAGRWRQVGRALLPQQLP